MLSCSDAVSCLPLCCHFSSAKKIADHKSEDRDNRNYKLFVKHQNDMNFCQIKHLIELFAKLHAGRS